MGTCILPDLSQLHQTLSIINGTLLSSRFLGILIPMEVGFGRGEVVQPFIDFVSFSARDSSDLRQQPVPNITGCKQTFLEYCSTRGEVPSLEGIDDPFDVLAIGQMHRSDLGQQSSINPVADA